MLELLTATILTISGLHSGGDVPLSIIVRNESRVETSGTLLFRLENYDDSGMWRIWVLPITTANHLIDVRTSVNLPNDLPSGKYRLWISTRGSDPVALTFDSVQLRTYRVFIPYLRVDATASACFSPC